MANYKFLILLFLLLSVCFLHSIERVSEATEIAKEYMYVTVFYLKVKLTLLIDERTCPITPIPRYCPEDFVNMTNKLENIGSNTTGNLTTVILNATGYEIHSEKWFNINLTVRETEYHITNYTIEEKDKRGTYRIKSNLTYDGNFTETSCNIYVKEGIGFLSRDPSKIEATILPGDSNSSIVDLWLDDACLETIATLNVTGYIKDWISLSPDELLLTPIEKNFTVVAITVPSDTTDGIYNGTVNAYADDQFVSIFLNVTVPAIPVTTIPPTPEGPGPAVAPTPPVQPPTPVYAMTLNLSTDILSVIIGNRTSFIASVNNTGTEVLTSVKISIEGIPLNWINIFPLTANITPRTTEDYLVIISVPRDAEIGVYKLKVKATDKVESNTEILTLVIGRNEKEIADLLLKELERMRAEANESLLIEECIDVTVIKTYYNEAELSLKNGIEEYENENYLVAINWFEHAVPLERKVVHRVDIAIEVEIETSNTSKFVIPSFLEPEEQFQLAGIYLDEKNYEKICDPIVKIRNLVLIGLIFWPAVVIIIIVLIIVFVIIYRRKRRYERAEILERLRERFKRPKDIASS